MIKIMNKPDWIDNPSWYNKKCKESYFTGQQVLSKFYDVSIGYGSLTECNIPKELKNNHWCPEDNKTYKCWWYWTNPSDPADPGEDILVYIEELEKSNKTNEEDTIRNEYILKINDYISKVSLNKLKNIYENIKNF